MGQPVSGRHPVDSGQLCHPHRAQHLFVSGYILRVMRQTVDGYEPALPTWDDWGSMFKDGLGAMVVGLVYFFPALLVLIGGMVLYFAGTLYLPFTASTSAQPEETLMLMPMLTLGSMAIIFLSMFLGTLFSLLPPSSSAPSSPS